MSESKTDTLKAFLASLQVSAEGGSTPLTATAIQEMQDELDKKAVELSKQQLRDVYAHVQQTVSQLRLARRRVRAHEDALDRLNKMAESVATGTLDTNDATFLQQIYYASSTGGKILL